MGGNGTGSKREQYSKSNHTQIRKAKKMINITILGKERKLPENINEVLWGAYKSILQKEKELERGLDPVEFFSLLIGEKEEVIRQYGGDGEFVEGGIIDVILWYHKYIYKELRAIKTPDQKDFTKTVYDGKEYESPKQLEWKTTGQMQDGLEVANNIYQDQSNEMYIQVIERLYAIYFQPIVEGKEYKVEDAAAFNPDLARAVDVRTFGAFFLMKLIGYSTGTKKSATIADIVRKKALPDLMKSQLTTSLT